MAKKNKRNDVTPKIIRNYDIFSIEKRVHDLEENGGGGGGIQGITRTVLLDTPATTPGTVTLSETVNNFDFLEIIVYLDPVKEYTPIMVPVASISSYYSGDNELFITGYGSRNIKMKISDTSVQITRVEQLQLYAIIGYKWS